MGDATNGDGGGTAGRALPLLYRSILVLDAQQNGTLCLRERIGYHFAKGTNSVPINANEMAQVAIDYPIAFAPADPPVPIAILGLRSEENLFVDADGEWASSCYVPAYIRRYPFIVAESEGGKKLTLCIDDSPDVVDESGGGRRLFENGEPSDLTNKAAAFCSAFTAEARQTQAFGRALEEAGLLVGRALEATLGGSEKVTLGGFRMIDVEKFRALDDAVILDWRRRGWLDAIYAHLVSLGAWRKLVDRAGSRAAAG